MLGTVSSLRRSSFTLATFLCLTVVLFGNSQAMAERVLIVSENLPDMNEVKQSLQQKLRKHTIDDFILTQQTTYTQFLQHVQEQKPEALVLFDNKALELVRQLRSEKDPVLARIPAFATMALNLRESARDIPHVAGIIYEVPAFTILTQFRAISGMSLENVLVFYRKSRFEDTIREATLQLEREGIHLIALNVEEAGTSEEAVDKFIADHLERKWQQKDLQAVWILLDNIILARSNFKSIWLSKAKSLGIPFVCGMQPYVSNEIKLCAFASYPEYKDLGVQLGDQILDYFEEGKRPEDIGLEHIVSTRQALNVSLMKAAGWKIRDRELDAVQLIR